MLLQQCICIFHRPFSTHLQIFGFAPILLLYGEVWNGGSNGSEPNGCNLIDGKATFILSVFDREYEIAKPVAQVLKVQFQEMEVLCTIKEIVPADEDKGEGDRIVIEEAKILSVNGEKEV